MGIVFTFIELLFMLILYSIIFGEISIKKITLYIFISLVGALVNIITISYLGLDKPIVSIALLISVSYIFSKIYKKDVMEILPEFIISTIMVIIIELIFTVVLVIVFKNKEVSSINLVFIVTASMITGVFIIKIIFNKFKLYRIKNISKYGNINIVLFNFSIFFMILLMIKDIFKVNFKNLLEISVLCFSLITVNIYYLIGSNKKRDFNKKLEIDNNINPLIDDLLQDMKAKEHEYNNHLTVIYSMIQVCKPEELKAKSKVYLGDMKDKNEYLKEISYIKNTIVQAIIYNKLKEAEKLDINLNHDVESDLKNIKLDNSELAVVLSNLINNAIDATKNQLNREIDIYIGEEQDKYIIQVANCIEDSKSVDIKKIFKKGISTKGIGRGYGLHNIKSVIDKKKGKIHVQLDENRIKFIIYI